MGWKWVWGIGIVLVLVVGGVFTLHGKSPQTSEAVNTNTNTGGQGTPSSQSSNVSSSKSPDVQTSQPSSNQTNSDTVQISQIKSDMKGQTVTVSGTIADETKSSQGTVFLTLKDDTGQISVPIFTNTDIKVPDNMNGHPYSISGTVDVYQSALEIIPQGSSDIKEVQTSPTVAIDESNLGKMVEVQAKVLSIYHHPAGHVFLTVQLMDDQSELEVPIFKNLEYDSTQLTVGGTVLIKGKVSKYNGKIEVIPEDKSDITILTNGDESTIQEMAIQNISDQQRGMMLQVKGKVRDVSENNGTMFFNFYDPSTNAEIKAVLFRADGNEIIGRKTKIKDAEIQDFPIRILAMVDQYEGNTELVVDKVYNDY